MTYWKSMMGVMLVASLAACEEEELTAVDTGYALEASRKAVEPAEPAAVQTVECGKLKTVYTNGTSVVQPVMVSVSTTCPKGTLRVFNGDDEVAGLAVTAASGQSALHHIEVSHHDLSTDELKPGNAITVTCCEQEESEPDDECTIEITPT